MLANGLHDVPPGKLACVVTRLVLRERFPLADHPAPTGVTLRIVAQPDSGWYRTLFRAVGAPWLWTSRLLLDDPALRRILDDPGVTVAVVAREGLEIGFFELDFRQAGRCEIAFLGLVPQETGRGMGRWLMGQALVMAWRGPVTAIHLQTCTLDHPAALGVYRAHGFVPTGRQVEILDDPRATGLLEEGVAPGMPRL